MHMMCASIMTTEGQTGFFRHAVYRHDQPKKCPTSAFSTTDLLSTRSEIVVKVLSARMQLLMHGNLQESRNAMEGLATRTQSMELKIVVNTTIEICNNMSAPSTHRKYCLTSCTRPKPELSLHACIACTRQSYSSRLQPKCSKSTQCATGAMLPCLTESK